MEGELAMVTREVESGTQTLRLKLPAVVTSDLRLNEPRFISLPSLMKARQATVETSTPADWGVEVRTRLETISVLAPEARKRGETVPDVATLHARLQARGAL